MRPNGAHTSNYLSPIGLTKSVDILVTYISMTFTGSFKDGTVPRGR